MYDNVNRALRTAERAIAVAARIEGAAIALFLGSQALGSAVRLTLS